jgi:hypothetical protein
MKKCGIVLTALVFSLLCAGQCFADESELRYKIIYQAEEGGCVGTQVCVVGFEGAGPGFDGEELWPLSPPAAVLVGIRKVKGADGWDGTTGWYTGDIRDNLSPGANTTVDGIYMWAVTGTEGQDMHLRLTMAWLYPSENGRLRLSLVSIPQGVDYTGPTTWGPETTEITLPLYSTDDGTTGYKFQMNVFAVPEPSSLIALAGGLAGLGGMALRRKRR